MVDFGTPFKIQWAPKWLQNSTKWHKKVIVSKSGVSPFAHPCFHATIFSYYCVVGTSWLSKGHLFDGAWLSVCYCCVSLNSVLYNMSITCFHKTSVNVKPVSLHIVEEIAAYRKQHVFSHFCVCVFVLFFYILIDLLVPLATPLGQLGPIFGRL